MVEVRPFARRDRDQLSRLVNAHVAAVTPGGSVPAATLSSDLERPLSEYIIGPWVTEMVTMVGVEDDRAVAGAHLRRYTGEPRASDSYRDAGEIVWLVCWPHHLDVGRELLEAAVAQMDRWQVRAQYADGTLPAPGVFGVSEAWPHVRRLYHEAGFDAGRAREEIVLTGTLERIPDPAGPPVAGLGLARQVATLGTAFNAMDEVETVGSFEVDDDLSRGGANLAFAGWADECNHWVRADLRGRGIGSWLVGEAANWLRLAGRNRLMVYVVGGDDAEAWCRYYARYGLWPTNRTIRGNGTFASRGWPDGTPRVPAPVVCGYPSVALRVEEAP